VQLADERVNGEWGLFPLFIAALSVNVLIQATLAIPCGRVATYGGLAARLRSSSRAVGQVSQATTAITFVRALRHPLLMPSVYSVGLFSFITRGKGQRQRLQIRRNPFLTSGEGWVRVHLAGEGGGGPNGFYPRFASGNDQGPVCQAQSVENASDDS
jgi:hypothetical protein